VPLQPADCNELICFTIYVYYSHENVGSKLNNNDDTNERSFPPSVFIDTYRGKYCTKISFEVDLQHMKSEYFILTGSASQRCDSGLAGLRNDFQETNGRLAGRQDLYECVCFMFDCYSVLFIKL
jgi:hypothetical protein